jgi:hypothetical protein
MNELDIHIEKLELEECDLVGAICKPTNYNKSPTSKELEFMTDNGIALGKVVFALHALKELKDDIEANKR